MRKNTGKTSPGREKWFIQGRDNRVLVILLAVLLAGQFLVLAWFNLAHLADHMGFDSTWAYLRAALMWNEKALVSPNWEETTNLFLDTPALPAALLFGLTGNLFTAYGLANILILAGILLCILSVFRRLKLSLTAALFSMNLVLCPFLMNGFSLPQDLSYLGDMLAGAAYYSLRVLTMLLIVRQFVILRTGGKFDGWLVLAFPLCFMAGASSGVYLFLMVLLPCLAFLAEEAMIHNQLKRLWSREALFTYACILFILAGRKVGSNVFHFLAFDAEKTWTPIAAFWTNIGASFQGLLKLMAVLPVYETDRIILTVPEIFRVFPLFLLFMMVLSLGASVKAAFRDWLAEHGFILLLLNIVALNFLMFGLFNVQYGTPIFEDRYLVSTYVFLSLLVGVFIHRLPAKHLATWILCGALLVSVAGIDALSDRTYLSESNDMDEMAQIRDAAERENAGLVCFWGSNLRILSMRMRVFDLDRVYKLVDIDWAPVYYHGGGDYKYLDRNEDYSGPVLLLIEADNDNPPEGLEEHFEPAGQIGGINLYRCDHNPLHY